MSEAARDAVAGYLRLAGLESLAGREADVERAVRDLLEAMGEKVEVADLDTLYRYPVPMLTEDGTCSVVDELSPVPYDLAPILGGRSDLASRRLGLLERLVERAQEVTAVDWLGVYQARDNPKGERVLVKLSYVGRPSRAEFPLTREFAARSTNSTVGLTGRAVLIDDVAKHVEAGGGFYVCDDGVQSEACLPIYSNESTASGDPARGRHVAGIIDAEAKPRGYFNGERLAVLAALAIAAGAVLP